MNNSSKTTPYVKPVEKRFTTFEVGFRQGTFDTLEEAMACARRCYEYSYVVDNETGKEHHYGGPVSG